MPTPNVVIIRITLTGTVIERDIPTNLEAIRVEGRAKTEAEAVEVAIKNLRQKLVR